MIEAPIAEAALTRAPRSFLIRFDDATNARLNAWAQESGCAATHLITQIVKDVLNADALAHGEEPLADERLSVEAQLVFAQKMWRRGFGADRISKFLQVEESAVYNALDAIKKGSKA